MPPLLPGWVWAAVAAGLMAVSGLAGYRLAADRCEARVARMQSDFAAAREAAAQESARRLAAALAAADASVAAALQQRDAADAKSKEIARELSRQKLLSGRACLSGAAVGLLNSHPAIGLNLPATAASAANPAARSAADPANTRPDAGATDADLAAWALDAMTLYQTCRARIDALRQWDAEVNGGG